MTKIAGCGSGSGSESGAGYIRTRHGSADPDPDPDPPQNVMIRNTAIYRTQKPLPPVLRGLQRDVVYLSWTISPSYMIPNAEGGVAGSQPMSSWVPVQLCTWSPDKFGRSSSIFNLWLYCILQWIRPQDRNKIFWWKWLLGLNNNLSSNGF